jgi:hypothetical protein
MRCNVDCGESRLVLCYPRVTSTVKKRDNDFNMSSTDCQHERRLPPGLLHIYIGSTSEQGLSAIQFAVMCRHVERSDTKLVD